MKKTSMARLRCYYFVIAVIFVLIVTGCSVQSMGQYSVSVNNVEDTRMRFGPRTGHYVNVGPFNSLKPGVAEIWCRAKGPLRTPDGKPFAEYIRGALVDELRIADALSNDATTTLTGRLDRIDFDSQAGVWNISATIRLSSGESFAVSEAYRYDTSWYAPTACDRTALAFVPAVQKLVRKVIDHVALDPQRG